MSGQKNQTEVTRLTFMESNLRIIKSNLKIMKVKDFTQLNN